MKSNSEKKEILMRDDSILKVVLLAVPWFFIFFMLMGLTIASICGYKPNKSLGVILCILIPIWMVNLLVLLSKIDAPPIIAAFLLNCSILFAAGVACVYGYLPERIFDAVNWVGQPILVINFALLVYKTKNKNRQQ